MTKVLGEKHMRQRQYTIRDLVTKSRSEIWIKSEIWYQKFDIGRQIAEQSFIEFDSN